MLFLSCSNKIFRYDKSFTVGGSADPYCICLTLNKPTASYDYLRYEEYSSTQNLNFTPYSTKL